MAGENETVATDLYYCWSCKNSQYHQQKVDKLHGNMIYLECNICKATTIPQSKKRKK